MKVDKMTKNEGSRGDKSIVWTVSDTYVNWCRIMIGNPEYLDKLYSSTVKKGGQKTALETVTAPGTEAPGTDTQGKRKSCPCYSNQATGPTVAAGPCSFEEFSQWQKIVELITLKHKCAELQRRLQNETFYKCRMAMTKDCKKQVFECPCVPRKHESYVKPEPNKVDVKGKKGKTKRGRKEQVGKLKDKGIVVSGKTRKRGLKREESKDNCLEYKLSTDEKNAGNFAKKIFTFQTDPFCFEGNCFKQRQCGEKYFYSNGTLAAMFECDGTGMIFYPNGEKAVTVSRGKLGCRLQVMSKSGHDEKGQYSTSVPIGLFDSKGNGVIYDNYGKIRLNYDQAEGILYDTPSGVPARWQWKLHSFIKKRREQLQGVKEDPVDDEFEQNEPKAVEDEEEKEEKKEKKKQNKETATRRKSSIKTPVSNHGYKNLRSTSQSQRYSNMSQFSRPEPKTNKEKDHMEDWAALIEEQQVRVAIEPKPVVLKLNQFLALRIMKQDHIHLDFRAFPFHFHLNLGVKLKPEWIERIDKVTVLNAQQSAVPCYFELLHTRTKSLRDLHSDLETIRKDTINEDKINFIKKAKLMGILKYITQMAMKKLTQDEQQLTKIIYKCQ